MSALSGPDPVEATGSTARSAAALELRGIRKSFGQHEVLRGIDLTVGAHEVICLIGASGSGKSTLLRCVNLLEPLSAGSILLGGQEITARGVNPDLVRRHIGIVFSPTTCSRT